MYPRNMVCFRYIIVNNLQKGDNKDDDGGGGGCGYDDDDDDDDTVSQTTGNVIKETFDPFQTLNTQFCRQVYYVLEW
jgi:hypothetical protein